MEKDEKNSLKFLGDDFQYKLVHTLMDDHSFFEDLYPILNQNMFTDSNLRVCVGVIKDYFEKHSVVPSYQVLGIALCDKAHTEVDKDYYMATLKKIEAFPSDGVDFIRDLALKFFRQQNMIRVAHEILDVVKCGDLSQYDKCVDLINQASIQGTHDDYGVSVLDDIETVLSEENRTPIPTGIEALDFLLEGGLAKGEVGLIIGPTGFGKTSLTTSFATEASCFACEDNNYHGYRVLQIVTEDPAPSIQRKHIAKIVQIESKDISKPEYIETTKQRLKAFPALQAWTQNLRIKRVRTGETSVDDLKHLIKKFTNRGFKPDMLVVDYFEALNHDVFRNVTNDYQKEAKSMRKLEALAHEMDIAIWLPSQGTKDSAECEIVTMSKNGGAVQKTQIANVVISIARTEDDKDNNRATIALLKNRSGKSGKVLQNCYFNNGTCTISKSMHDFDSTVSFSQFNYKRKEEDEMSLQMTLQSLKGNKTNK